MNNYERASCIITLKVLRKFALNMHGLIDVVDDTNVDKMIAHFEQPEPSTVWHNTYEEGFPPEGEQVLVTYDTSNSNFFWIDESIANDKGLRWSEDCDLWEKTKWAYFSDLLKAQPGTLQNLPKPNNGFEGWIPFHENPEQEGIYFVTVQCRHMEGYPDYELCYGEYTKDYGWDLFRDPIGWVDIVAWMSITKPAPYQPKEEAE